MGVKKNFHVSDYFEIVTSFLSFSKILVEIATLLAIAARILFEVSFSRAFEVCAATKCNSMFSPWLSPAEHFDITYRQPPLLYDTV